MATATGKAFWSHCSSAQCDQAGSGGRRFLTAKDTTGRGLCVPCGKAAGEGARPLASVVFGDTDTVQERHSLTTTAQLQRVQQGSHKSLHTEGGRVKGGTPEAVTKAVQAKLPKVKAPKVAAKAARKRPAAKTA